MTMTFEQARDYFRPAEQDPRGKCFHTKGHICFQHPRRNVLVIERDSGAHTLVAQADFNLDMANAIESTIELGMYDLSDGALVALRKWFGRSRRKPQAKVRELWRLD